MADQCTLPPAGWRCTRTPGHEGPCAALPVDVSFVIHGELPSGTAGILSERHRQIKAEGWTPDHDDEHANGELARAAYCYLLAAAVRGYELTASEVPPMWPWEASWWKPKGRRRNLERAGALIAAELARMDRAEAGS